MSESPEEKSVVVTAPTRAPLTRRRPVPNFMWPAVLLVLAAVFVSFTTAGAMFVAVPLCAGVLATMAFFRALWCRRYLLMPWFEIGSVYVAVVALYMAYPLIGFLALAQTYTPLNDARLVQLRPDAQEVGAIAWLYVCHLVAFAAAYLVVRGRLPVRVLPLRRPTPQVFQAVVAIYLVIEAFGVFVALFYDTGASTYAGTYLVARRLPLVLAQFFNHLNGMKYALSVMVLAALFSRYPASRWLLVGWLLAAGAVTVARFGSRTEMVLLVLSGAMMYQSLVRPLSPRLVASIAIIGLTAFIGFGVLRNGVSLLNWQFATNPFAYTNEFEAVFANALHLDTMKAAVRDLPLAFYFSDFMALVPQQIAPFTKIDVADWYVSTFFPQYAAAGGGLAFGTIAQAVVTGGWISALARGVALGFCFAKLHRFYVRHLDRFWVFVFYVWVTTLSYQSFRNSTFSLLVLFAYRFVPAVLMVNLLARALRRASRPHPMIGHEPRAVKA